MPGQRVDPLPLDFVPGSLDIFRSQALPHDLDPFVRLSVGRCPGNSRLKALADCRRAQLFRNAACLLMDEVSAALLQLGDFALKRDSEIKALDGSRSA